MDENTKLQENKLYETPQVVDYGDVSELTAATAIFGAEDGASKLTVLHHSLPPLP